MNNKIIFMIFNNQVMFLQNSTMDHKEWFLSVGGIEDQFENLIRGFILNNKIVFYKGNFSYDQEVLNCASFYGPYIRNVLNNNNLEICCGVLTNGQYNGWEPIVTLNEEELGKSLNHVKKAEESTEIQVEAKPQEPIIEFMNDYTNPEFIKTAIKFTLVILIISIIVKVIIFAFGNTVITGYDKLIMFMQIASLTGTIICFKKNISKVKIVALVGAISLFLMFDIFDIILGIVYLLFIIDTNYITKSKSFIKNIIDFIKSKIKRA